MIPETDLRKINGDELVAGMVSIHALSKSIIKVGPLESTRYHNHCSNKIINPCFRFQDCHGPLLKHQLRAIGNLLIEKTSKQKANADLAVYQSNVEFLPTDENFSESSDAILDSPGRFRSKREAGWDGDLKPCNFSDRVFTAKLFSNVSRLAAEKLSDTRSLPLEVHLVLVRSHRCNSLLCTMRKYLEHWQLHKWPLNKKYESVTFTLHTVRINL